MVYCYDKRYPLKSFLEEIAARRKNHQVLFYDGEKSEFTDYGGNVIDIKGKTLVCRTWGGHIEELNKVIEEFGGIPAISNEDTKKIHEWLKYYRPKRKTILFTGEELLNSDVQMELERTFGKEIFIKTLEKNFSGVISVSLLKDQECVFHRALKYHLHDSFIVSEKVDILEDNSGFKEYRCFVINGKIANISRMTDEVFHKIDEDVVARLQEIVRQVQGLFPAFYVVDVFQYMNHGCKEIDVVEFNPFQASGCYLYNSAIEVREDLTHEWLESIPREHWHNLEHTSYVGKMIEGREPLYNVAFSFANDLRSIYLTGTIGTLFTDAKINKEDWSSHGRVIDCKSFVPITDDSCLSDDSFLSDNLPAYEIGEKALKKIR